jgi:methylitaconate Delta-isomerase
MSGEKTDGRVDRIRCSILRGGTSRGVFFTLDALPQDRVERERILLRVLGSPDIRQIDGLGGASSQTSKAAIIGPPSRPDADVDYTFAQVSIGHPTVDWGGNCGNLSSAVGLFAIDQGLVEAVDPVTTVRIHNTNTGKIIIAEVAVSGGRSAQTGKQRIPGVPGQGPRVLLDFREPSGSYAGRLLPTGNPLDGMRLSDGRAVEVSLVDAGNPVIFVRARDLGMTGAELPPEIEARTDVTSALEEIRSIGAAWLGIVDDPALATVRTPGLPKVGFVAGPTTYMSTTGSEVRADEVDLLGRLMSMQTAHRSYMVTGAICTAAAAVTPGTVVAELVRAADQRLRPDALRIGNPYGVLVARVDAEAAVPEPAIRGVAVERTARHIMEGVVMVPSSGSAVDDAS